MIFHVCYPKPVVATLGVYLPFCNGLSDQIALVLKVLGLFDIIQSTLSSLTKNMNMVII